MDGMSYSVAPFSSTLKSTISKGYYEEPERELVRRWLPSHVPIVELGGGLGVVSCLANRKLNDPSKHVVVEANPAMVPLLEANRDSNGCQFEVVNLALGYDNETLMITIDPDFVGSSAYQSVSGVQVRTTNLESLMDARGFDQCGVICDIEGLEAELIKREFSKLGKRVRYLAAEFHPYIIGQEANDRTHLLLRQLGFVEKQSIGICSFYSR